jgi:hypothetical protein
MNHARGVDGDSAKLARIGEYATGVRMTILLTLLECFSALVLAVALYGITRDVDQELAMLAMACGVAESVLGSLRIPDYSGLLWLAKAGGSGRVPRTSLQLTRCLASHLATGRASTTSPSVDTSRTFGSLRCLPTHGSLEGYQDRARGARLHAASQFGPPSSARRSRALLAAPL